MPKAPRSGSSSSVTATAATTPPKRACDQCNYRRIKCNREEPCCNRCALSELTCTYEKATKARTGRRIQALQGIAQSEDDIEANGGFTIPNGDHGTLSFGRIEDLMRRPRQSRASLIGVADPTEATSATSGDFDTISPSDSLTLQQNVIGNNSTMLPFAPSPPAAAAANSSNTSLPPHANASTSQLDFDLTAGQTTFGVNSFYNETGTTGNLPFLSEEGDNFLSGLHDTLQSFPPQQPSDFSFLESWPFWLSETASNSPAYNSAVATTSSGVHVGEVSSTGTGTGTPQAQASQKEGYEPVPEAEPEQDYLADSQLIPAIACFFERLHPIMPIFTRSWILDRIDKEEHRSQPKLAAMLLALSSLSKIQPVKASERSSRSIRHQEARAMLEQSAISRASSTLGYNIEVDDVLASFYTFAVLFGLQMHDAATFRLREAITLAQLMKLNQHESYMFLDAAEQERRLRTYWLLCVTERAYALQRGDSIGLRGHPVADMAYVAAGLAPNSLRDFPQRQLRLFDNVDENFVDCWHGRCPRSNCLTFTRERAKLLHAAFAANFSHSDNTNNVPGYKKMSSWQREFIQSIDVALTSQWLQTRLFQVCLTHNLLSSTSQELIFRPAFIVQLAYASHQHYVSADASSREAHGVGLIEKLFDIGIALLQARGMAGIDDALRSNIDQILSLYLNDLSNSSEEGKAFSERLSTEWQSSRGYAAGS